MSGASSDIGSAMDADNNVHADKGLAAMLDTTEPAAGGLDQAARDQADRDCEAAEGQLLPHRRHDHLGDH